MLIDALILVMVLDSIHLQFVLVQNVDFGKNVTISGLNNSSSAPTDNRQKYIF